MKIFRLTYKSFAFTLAEVLITLGVIGVVAAITLPTLVQNYKKHVVETKLKRFYTNMNQAIKLSEAEYGDIENWGKYCGTSAINVCTREQAKEWFNTYIGKHLNITKIMDSPTGNFIVYLNDGSILTVPKYIYDMTYFLDQKAIDNKKLGVNYFNFRFISFNLDSVEANSSVLDFNQNKYNYLKFEPYAWDWDGKKSSLFIDHKGKSYGCSQNGMYCTKLIQYNGWKIPNDYPYRF